MPPAFTPYPSDTLKAVLETDGWEVIDEDEYNWLLGKGSETITLPKVELISLTILNHIYEKTGLNPRDFYGMLTTGIRPER